MNKKQIKNIGENSVKYYKLYKQCNHIYSLIPIPDPIDGHILRPDKNYIPCKLCGVFFPRDILDK